MNWNKYFIEIMDVIKTKSHDPSTKVGCVIVGPGNEIRSTGFNGFARGVDSTIESRLQRPEKYMWMEHSERNAIYNAARVGTSLVGCKIYVSWIPCCDCARGIIQAGITEVIIDGRDFEKTNQYWNERWADSMRVSKEMLEDAKVKLSVCDEDGNLIDFYECI